MAVNRLDPLDREKQAPREISSAPKRHNKVGAVAISSAILVALASRTHADEPTPPIMRPAGAAPTSAVTPDAGTLPLLRPAGHRETATSTTVERGGVGSVIPMTLTLPDGRTVEVDCSVRAIKQGIADSNKIDWASFKGRIRVIIDGTVDNCVIKGTITIDSDEFSLPPTPIVISLSELIGKAAGNCPTNVPAGSKLTIKNRKGGNGDGSRADRDGFELLKPYDPKTYFIVEDPADLAADDTTTPRKVKKSNMGRQFPSAEALADKKVTFYVTGPFDNVGLELYPLLPTEKADLEKLGDFKIQVFVNGKEIGESIPKIDVKKASTAGTPKREDKFKRVRKGIITKSLAKIPDGSTAEITVVANMPMEVRVVEMLGKGASRPIPETRTAEILPALEVPPLDDPQLPPTVTIRNRIRVLMGKPSEWSLAYKDLLPLGVRGQPADPARTPISYREHASSLPTLPTGLVPHITPVKSREGRNWAESRHVKFTLERGTPGTLDAVVYDFGDEASGGIDLTKKDPAALTHTYNGKLVIPPPHSSIAGPARLIVHLNGPAGGAFTVQDDPAKNWLCQENTIASAVDAAGKTHANITCWNNGAVASGLRDNRFDDKRRYVLRPKALHTARGR